MAAWIAGDVVDDGNTAAGYVGDIATGAGFYVEVTRPDIPTARVTMWFAVVEYEAGGDFPYAVEDGTEYLTGTDPEDLPGTETYCDIERGEGSHLAFTTAEEATNAARNMAERARFVTNEYDTLTWDGVTPIR